MSKNRQTSELINHISVDSSGSIVMTGDIIMPGGSKAATQSYVTTAISNLVASAPSTLDTLNELATALGNDANFATTVATSIGTKLPLSGGTLTGTLTGTIANFSGIVQSSDRLYIAGQTTPSNWISSALTAGYNASGTQGWIQADGSLALGTNGVSYFTIASNGASTFNGSISGTSGNFNGNVRAVDTYNLYKSGNATLGGQLSYDSVINQLYLWNNISSGFFSIYTNSTERLNIGSDGTSTFKGPGIVVNRPAASSGEPFVAFSKDGVTRASIYGADGTAGLRFFSDVNTFFGNVGIGAAPSFPLDMLTSSSGTFNTIAQFQNTNYTSGNRSFLRVRQWTNAGGSYSSYFGTGQDGNLCIIANDSARGGDLIINAGTGTATFVGDVNSTNSGFQGRYSRIYEASAQRGGLYPYNLILGSGTDYSIGLFSESSMWFAAGGTTTKHLLITSSGNFGFNNSSPNRHYVFSNPNSRGSEGFEINAQNGIITFLSYNRATSTYLPISLSEGTSNVLVNTTTDHGHRFQVSGTSYFSGITTIGQTSPNGAVNGIYFRPGIESGFIVTSDVALQLSRLGTTGDIQTFYTGSTRVGKIAVGSSIVTFESASNGGVSVFDSGNVTVGSISGNVYKFNVSGSVRSNRVIYNWYNGAWQGNGTYYHMKTNLYAGGAGNTQYTMSYFKGYSYSYSAHILEGGIGFHNWSGYLYNLRTTGNLFTTAYVSSDGYVVLVIPSGYGESGVTLDWHQHWDYPFISSTVTAAGLHGATTGKY